MLRKMFDRLDDLGQRTVNRLGRFSFGPPTPEYHNQYAVCFYFQLRQVALSLRWDTDGAARDFILKVGPVGVHGTIARAALVPDPVDPPSTLKVRPVRGTRELSTWRNWRHVGFCLDWFPPAKMVRVEAGPFGAAIMESGW